MMPTLGERLGDEAMQRVKNEIQGKKGIERESLLSIALIMEVVSLYDREMKELRARVSAVEEHGIAYKGVHQRAIEYKRGEVVTSEGSAWIALVDQAKGKPGTNDEWQLFVKAGRDAR
jgi:shikimate kinase